MLPTPRLLCLGLVLAPWLLPQPARAQEPVPAIAPDGLGGGRYVAAGLDGERPSLRLAGTVGYGFTESVLGEGDRHDRAAGELAIAWVMAPWLQATIAGELRVDRHSPDGPGRETGLLGSTRLATRHVLRLGSRAALGFAPKVIFPGADRTSRGFRAASYELLALFSARLPGAIELSLNGGYRFDRSRFAVKDALELAPAQRLAASLSQQDACLLGALISWPVNAYRLSAEWSWEPALRGRVHALESPMRVRAAVQRVIGERYVPGLELGVDASQRPTFLGLTRIEPRVWARVGLAVFLERRQPERATAPGEPLAPEQSAPEPAALRALQLRVVDASGQPIAGARVWLSGDRERSSSRTDAEGNVTLRVSEGAVSITIEADGYEPIERTLAGNASDSTLALKPELPAGEIKGAVRNLAGDPVHASVTVLPQAMTVKTDARGQFAIGVAPGDYTLKIVADGYEPQERRAQVELRGVTIVVVDLVVLAREPARLDRKARP